MQEWLRREDYLEGWVLDPAGQIGIYFCINSLYYLYFQG